MQQNSSTPDSDLWSRRSSPPTSVSASQFPNSYNDILVPNLRPAVSVGVQQHSVRDVPQVALLFLQLCPEESRAVEVPVEVLGIKPHLSSSTVSDAGERMAAVHEVRRGRDLVVLCCAWRVGHAGLGAGDYLVKLVAVVPCTLVGRNGMWGVVQAAVNIFIEI